MSDVAETLRAVRPEGRGSPPTVGALRHELNRRRRRRQRVLAGAVTATAAIGLAGRLMALGADSHDVIETAVGEDLVGSSADLTPSTLVGAGSGEWSVLLPIEEWRPVALESTPLPVDSLVTGGRLWIGDPDQGPLGPLVEASFNPDFDSFEELADGPTNEDDRIAANGTTVRLGFDHGPDALDALVLVDGGSVALQTVGLDEQAVVELAAALRVEDGVPVVAEADVPVELAVLAAPAAEPDYRTQIDLSRADGTKLQVEVLPSSAWDAVLAARVDGAGSVEEAETPEGRGFTFRQDGGVYGAAVLTDDRFYRFTDRAFLDAVDGSEEVDGAPTSGLAAEDVEPGSTIGRPDLTALVEDLSRFTASDLVEELDQLEPRNDVVETWLAGAELPPGHGLEWLAEGPPLNPEAEAGTLHLWLVCSLVDEWERTGDQADLDAVAAASAWPSGRMLVSAQATAGDPASGVDVLQFEMLADEAKADPTATDRSTSDLRHSCIEPLGSA